MHPIPMRLPFLVDSSLKSDVLDTKIQFNKKITFIFESEVPIASDLI
jgi:hypothetical protein